MSEIMLTQPCGATETQILISQNAHEKNCVVCKCEWRPNCIDAFTAVEVGKVKW